MKKKYIIISVICIICAAACALIAMFGTGLFGKGEPEAPPMAQPAQEEPEPEPAQSASSVPEETPYTSPIDFDALKAEKVGDKVQLKARLIPNRFLTEANEAGQKLFTSI